MRSLIRFITQLITDPWTYYFLFWFSVMAVVYWKGDRWEK